MDNPPKDNDLCQSTDLADEQNHAKELNLPVDNAVALENGNENVYPAEQKDNILNSDQVRSSILDIVYGVLFDPVRTFVGFAQKPPIVAVIIIFLALNLAEAIISLFTAPVYFDNIGGLPGLAEAGTKQALISFVALAGFSFALIKWFLMAGLLHLLAELYGGRGTARSVWAVYGVAGLPAVVMIPVQLLITLFTSGDLTDFITGLIALGLYVWGVLLLIIGLREVHLLSTGRAVLTVITPGLMVLLLTLVNIIFIGSALSTIFMQVF